MQRIAKPFQEKGILADHYLSAVRAVHVILLDRPRPRLTEIISNSITINELMLSL